jgi:phosphatidylglycerol:prolipoprotein diacylglycerol transferase
MLLHPQFDPVAVSFGTVQIHWYGLMYLVGFALFFVLGVYRCRDSWRGISRKDLEDLLFLGMLGVILGGRFGYVLFYQPAFYFSHPLQILSVWQGGMSAHGGFVGVVIAILYFAWSRKKNPFVIGDFVAPLVPLGFGFGRIGNFINGELWGRAAAPEIPWAMVFPQSGTDYPRHPSQLYEAGLEGIVLFAAVWLFSRKPRPTGAVSGLFLAGYGTLRFVVEFFREPDSFIGLELFSLSRGQWLSVPMILAGLGILWWAYRSKRLRALRSD